LLKGSSLTLIFYIFPPITEKFPIFRKISSITVKLLNSRNVSGIIEKKGDTYEKA